MSEIVEKKSSIRQIKYSAESFITRIDQVEDRISGLGDKVDERSNSNSNKKKNLQTEHTKSIEHD
jgi:hypothetical protein